MKKLSVILISTIVLASGCGKKEEPQTAVAETAPEKTAVAEASKSSEPSLASNLDSTMKNVQDSVVEQTSRIAEQTKAAASSALSSVDWSNLSWNDVSNVSYGDKDKLLQWVTPQLDALKKQLAGAAMKNGQLNLSALSDSGWQGAAKKVASALDMVRTSSPETWEMARGALITAWDALKTEASKYIGEDAATN